MFQKLGFPIIRFFDLLGHYIFFIQELIQKRSLSKSLWRRTVDQMYPLGIKSLPSTLVTAVFVGMAFTVQVSNEFIKFGAGDLIGGVVGMAIWRELGPLMTGVIVAGRVGAAIASEIGTMVVTEQVLALRALSQDVTKYLVLPRVLACVLMLPLLVAMADIAGFLSGLFIANTVGNVNPSVYFSSAQSMLEIYDILGGLIKGIIFGFVIATVSTFVGLRTEHGAKGVGSSATFSVVVSLTVIFILNYFLSLLLY